jgi:deoxycytidylate deaminase
MPAEVFNLSKQERRFLNLAVRVASSSEMRQRHGAVVVKSGRVLAVGVNKFRNHPAQTASDRVKKDCSVHAEVDALSRCDPRGASVFVARVNNAGTIRYSRPCARCQQVLKAAGVKKVVWSNGKEEK